jgi:hypothetical protein
LCLAAESFTLSHVVLQGWLSGAAAGLTDFADGVADLVAAAHCKLNQFDLPNTNLNSPLFVSLPY